MKIVISGYVGKKITGIGRNLINLLDYAQGGTEFVIYTNYDIADEFKFSNKNVEVKTYPVSKNNSMGNLLWTTFVFPFVVLKEHSRRALIPNFTLLLFKFVPTYVIIHDLIEFNVPQKFSKKKMFYRTKLADPVTSKIANKIITVSQNSKSDIKKFLGVKDDKIEVIYSGVDQNKFTPASKSVCNEILQERNWPGHFLLYAGTIDHPGKNVIAVIKVFEHMKKTNSYDGKLVLAGMPGSGYETIKTYVEASEYKADIILTGYVIDEELIVLYTFCDVFCFVSLYEGFGIPPLEALSCGAKVVVSNTSSLPEVVGNIGWSANPRNLNDIEKAIKSALIANNDTIYHEKVKEHLKNYDWNNLGRQFEECLCRE